MKARVGDDPAQSWALQFTSHLLSAAWSNRGKGGWGRTGRVGVLPKAACGVGAGSY